MRNNPLFLALRTNPDISVEAFRAAAKNAVIPLYENDETEYPGQPSDPQYSYYQLVRDRMHLEKIYAHANKLHSAETKARAIHFATLAAAQLMPSLNILLTLLE